MVNIVRANFEHQKYKLKIKLEIKVFWWKILVIDGGEGLDAILFCVPCPLAIHLKMTPFSVLRDISSQSKYWLHGLWAQLKMDFVDFYSQGNVYHSHHGFGVRMSRESRIHFHGCLRQNSFKWILLKNWLLQYGGSLHFFAGGQFST